MTITNDQEQLLVATGNAGKIEELAALLTDLPLVLRSLKEFPQISEVEETGATFEENAILKAKAYAAQTGITTLADDSGLEVAALNGAPGVFSARYAGENARCRKNSEIIGRNRQKYEPKSEIRLFDRGC